MQGDAGGAGLPEPCPRCAGAGYLEHLDVSKSMKHEACRRCGHRWATPFGETAPEAPPVIAGRSTRTGLAQRLNAARA